MNSTTLKVFLLAFTIIGLLSCNKEIGEKISVTVNKNGTPVEGQFVSLVNYESPDPIAEGHTNAEGKVILDTEDYVFSEEESSKLVLLSADTAGCGYIFVENFSADYFIDLYTEEEVKLEVLSPDIEKETFAIGETIQIKMSLLSNYHPFVLKVGTVEAKGGELVEDLTTQRLQLKDLFFNRTGDLEFEYKTVAGENGFFISYNTELHGAGELVVSEFDIKVE